MQHAGGWQVGERLEDVAIEVDKCGGGREDDGFEGVCSIQGYFGADAAYARQIKAATRDPRLLRPAAALCENRIPAAEALLREHLKQFPTDVAAIRMFAEVAGRLGRYRDAENLLARALELGATDAECTLAEGEEFSAGVRMREVESLKQAGSRGAGIRVLAGRNTGSSRTSDLSEKDFRSPPGLSIVPTFS